VVRGDCCQFDFCERANMVTVEASPSHVVRFIYKRGAPVLWPLVFLYLQLVRRFHCGVSCPFFPVFPERLPMISAMIFRAHKIARIAQLSYTAGTRKRRPGGTRFCAIILAVNATPHEKSNSNFDRISSDCWMAFLCLHVDGE
jgi:hypothetical protein